MKTQTPRSFDGILPGFLIGAGFNLLLLMGVSGCALLNNFAIVTNDGPLPNQARDGFVMTLCVLVMANMLGLIGLALLRRKRLFTGALIGTILGTTLSMLTFWLISAMLLR